MMAAVSLAAALAAHAAAGAAPEESGPFRLPIKCPAGTQPYQDPVFKRLKCAAPAKREELVAPAAGGKKCPPGTALAASEDPFEPPRCAAPPKGSSAFQRYAGAELSFDYPRGWHLADAWSDSPPSLYLTLESERSGKPVTMTLVKYAKGREGYVSMAKAMERDRRLLGARDQPAGVAGGRTARFLAVAKETRTAYVEAGSGDYLTVNYSAPASLYAAYEAVYQRLLKSLRWRTDVR